jgi:hypothetical protein
MRKRATAMAVRPAMNDVRETVTSAVPVRDPARQLRQIVGDGR